jgi:hypothetical protein
MWCLRDVTGEARMRDARDTTRVGLPARAMLLGLGIETIRCAAAAARPARHWHRIGSQHQVVPSRAASLDPVSLSRAGNNKGTACVVSVACTKSSHMHERDVTVRYF